MRKAACLAVSFLATGSLQAAPIDLSSWSPLTLDYAASPQPGGNWVLNSDNTAVIQTENADPSFYLNNLDQTDYTIQGSWTVETTDDDDFMGFVFGYQNSSNFYLFDWKQATQTYQGATGNEGMSVKKFEGATGDGLVDLSLGEFWNNNQTNFGDMTVLASNHGAGLGWQDNVTYDFRLIFNEIANEFTINVAEGGTTLWDVTVMDSTFTSGEFGFYNFSQARVSYEGFEQDGGVIVDGPVNPLSNPTPFAMLSLALLAVGARRQS